MLNRVQLRFMDVSEELCQPLVKDLLFRRTSHARLRQREQLQDFDGFPVGFLGD